MVEISDEILSCLTNYYLDSGDFNGIRITNLQIIAKIPQNNLRDILINLINEGKISVNFGDRHPNPNIKAFEPESKSEQISKLENSNLHYACVYPEKEHLNAVVDIQKYQDRPFTLRLALGEPQNSFLSFDLCVLENYRNDPRYYYSTDDIQGWISVHDKYYESKEMLQSDQTLLQSFSFSYDEEFNRAVAVFLIYLSRLTPEHQQIWNAKRLDGKYFIHPEYALSSSGYFPENESVFTAFILELQIINEMCIAMGKSPLFHNDFKDGDRPSGFSFLIRPTAKEYHDFIHILDKMISDNLSKDFFKGDIDLEEEKNRNDGKIQVIQKGTIRLLDEWISKKFRTKDTQPIIDMIDCFKMIRRLRQKPAHSLDNNEFNQEFFKEQRELVFEAYTSIRTLRLLLANHPKCDQVEIPDWLYKGQISQF